MAAAQRRAVLLTEYRRGTGAGHLTRCRAIQSALNRYSYESLLLVNADRELPSSDALGPERSIDWISDFNACDGLVESADLVIIDSYKAEADFLAMLAERSKRIAYLDDYFRISYPPGFIVNGCVGITPNDYPDRRNEYVLAGAAYAPLRPAFWEVEAAPTNQKLTRLLITTGGADENNLTPELIKAADATQPGIRMHVVVGGQARNLAQVDAAASGKNADLHIAVAAEEMSAIMRSCDAALTAAGQTTYELARLGIPMILFQLSNNQARNIRGWKGVGGAIFAGAWNDPALYGNLSNAIIQLQSYENRKAFSQSLAAAIDGTGALRIVESLSYAAL
jgi:UDP-2,4-diacetamido-2,4,6-trideoxy-beta-L-altropyranose hydrolase